MSIRHYGELYPAACILATEGTHSELSHIVDVLEDSESPITQRFHSKLYHMVVDRNHIDFGNIPNSKGKVTMYSGYPAMIGTLEAIKEYPEATTASVVMDAVNTIETALAYLNQYSNSYALGFTKKSDYIIMEYNSIVAACVEATTSILYECVDYMKLPDRTLADIQFKDTKTRPNLFYIEQLKRYNKAASNPNYNKYLTYMINGEKDNFNGYTAIGFGAISIIASLSIPVIRELVYQFYNLRSKLSESCELQATFLEMNKLRLEADNEMNPSKKAKVIEKQEKAREKFSKLSDKLRVGGVQTRKQAVADIKKSDDMLSLNSIRDEIDKSPFSLV